MGTPDSLYRTRGWQPAPGRNPSGGHDGNTYLLQRAEPFRGADAIKKGLLQLQAIKRWPAAWPGAVLALIVIVEINDPLPPPTRRPTGCAIGPATAYPMASRSWSRPPGCYMPRTRRGTR